MPEAETVLESQQFLSHDHTSQIITWVDYLPQE